MVIDVNSPDSIATAVTEYIRTHQNVSVRLIRCIYNPGSVNSIGDGINTAKEKLIVWIDAAFPIRRKLSIYYRKKYLKDMISPWHRGKFTAQGEK